MSPPQQLRQRTSNCSSLLIYQPRKDERLSWPSWLTYSGWLTHIIGHPSAASRAQDSESTSAKDQCSTAGPRNQPVCWTVVTKTLFELEALGQCIPPPRHILPVSRSGSRGVAIQIRDSDRHQNLIICSLAHCQPSLKISCKSVGKFLRKVADRQTNKQTNDNYITSWAEVTRQSQTSHFSHAATIWWAASNMCLSVMHHMILLKILALYKSFTYLLTYLYAPLWANMTSSTKLEVYNLLHCCQTDRQTNNRYGNGAKGTDTVQITPLRRLENSSIFSLIRMC